MISKKYLYCLPPIIGVLVLVVLRWIPSPEVNARRITSRAPKNMTPETTQGTVNVYHYSTSVTGDYTDSVHEWNAALAEDSRISYALRVKIVRALPRNLKSAERQGLAAFVADSQAIDGLTEVEVRALKNEILNCLGAQHSGLKELIDFLCALYADENQDPAIRDYALQHLAEIDPSETKLSAHWAAAKGRDSNLAATAMLHLLSWNREGRLSEDDVNQLGGVAWNLASNLQVPATNRITALQVCGHLKLPQARNLAFILARSDRESDLLRIAAIATLGDLGGSSDMREYLASLANRPESRLSIPAASALQRFIVH